MLGLGLEGPQLRGGRLRVVTCFCCGCGSGCGLLVEVGGVKVWWE